MSNSGEDGRTNLHGFSQLVFHWFTYNGRDFPWRKTSNPYYIFVAEVLLRQTQAKRVVESYLELVERYPTFEALSQADVDELRKWFKPLGLVKRADLLVDAANHVVYEHDGQLPKSLNALLDLPGIGDYSARAIACLAFGATVPMIDESSGRLLRRVLGLTSKRPAHSDHKLLKTAETIVPLECARDFNLGLLDIASAYCHHNNPSCFRCPLAELCSYAQKLKK